MLLSFSVRVVAIYIMAFSHHSGFNEPNLMAAVCSESATSRIEMQVCEVNEIKAGKG